MTNPKYKMIGRGKVGWHAEAKNLSSSGGTLKGYLEEAEENCLVYDATEVDYDLFAKFVMCGPMCKVDLPENTVDRFTDLDRETAKRMMPGLSGGFEKMAAHAIQSRNYSSFDNVSLDIYEGLLRALPGMKIGRVKKGEIVWE